MKKNSFLVNIVTLVSGTSISQGILLFATPFLTRLFSPKDFGAFVLYLAIVGTISVVSSWKYELAIMLPKKEEDAQALLFISIVITFFTSFFSFLIILVFHGLICKFLDNIENIIWIVPLGILFSGLLQIFNAWITRKKYFKTFAGARVTQSGFSVFSQIFFKISNFVKYGLIWGNVFGTISSLIVLFICSIKKNSINFKKLSKNIIISNIKKYDRLPKYQSFSTLLNSISQNLPVILLSALYSPEIAGYYGLTRRVLKTPSRLIGESVRNVYYQRASELFSERKSIKKIFVSTTLNLAKISILPLLILGIFSKHIFTIVFGASWTISSIYVQILIPFTFIAFINPPAVMTIQILGLQKFSLIYEIIIMFFRFASIYLGYLLMNNHFASVSFYSLVGLIFNSFLIIFIYRKICLQSKNSVLINEY